MQPEAYAWFCAKNSPGMANCNEVDPAPLYTRAWQSYGLPAYSFHGAKGAA